MWDERATFHLDTSMYREFVAQLRAGRDALLPFDDAVLGKLEGLDVLHLQCHVGTDTLSLARRGANVVGVDFSPEALAKARALGDELGIAAEFLESDVYGLPQKLRRDFDLVYTSYGVLVWLDDLAAWARIVAKAVRPGGRLVVIDSHPLGTAMAELQDPEGGTVVLDWPYLEQSQPQRCDQPGSYADPEAATEQNLTYEWTHGLGEIVQSVIDAGLRIDRLHEHAEGFCGRPGMLRGDDRLWRLPPPLHGKVPLTFTLVASRPA